MTRERTGCACPGPRLERFIQPCMLLLLAEQPAHGYDLMLRLNRFGFGEGPDPAMVYRNLRRLEESGYVVSSWESSDTGPDRRSYMITPDGRVQLAGWASALAERRNSITEFLQAYERLI